MDGTALKPGASPSLRQRKSIARPSRSDPEGQVGRTLDGRHRLDAVIGRGGMGYVYRATHTRIGKVVAVKILRPEHATDPGVVERFLREARLASVLEHPNIVDISDYGELPEGGAYYVMELLTGRTLAERIDADGPVDPQQALGIALQICAGLQCAHEQGVVHRDLKPDNVYLCSATDGAPVPEPKVKLFDFGIARAQSARITATGAVLGTPEYMSPEQARGEDVDARADLYALGVILFEMLTGLVPFCSSDVTKVIYSQIHGTPPTLAGVAPPLRRLHQTDAVLSHLLAKSPAARPSSAAEAAERLADAMAADLGQDRVAGGGRSTLAIGSGGIAGRGEVRVDRDVGSWKPRLDWSSSSSEQTASAEDRSSGGSASARHVGRSPRWGPILGIASVSVIVSMLVAVGWLRGWWFGPERSSTPLRPEVTPSDPVPATVAPAPTQKAPPRGVPTPVSRELDEPSLSGPESPRESMAPVGPQTRDENAESADRAPPSRPRSESNPPRTRSKRGRTHTEQGAPESAGATGSTRSAHAPPVDTEPAAVPTSSVVRGRSGDLKDPFATKN